jgi:hypothetical protein
MYITSTAAAAAKKVESKHKGKISQREKISGSRKKKFPPENSAPRLKWLSNAQGQNKYITSRHARDIFHG